jgi:hypothetical protein
MFGLIKLPQQLQPRPMSAARGHKPRSGRAKHELADLSPLAPDLQSSACLMHGQHDARLEAAAEVHDADMSADARDLPRGPEHT